MKYSISHSLYKIAFFCNIVEGLVILRSEGFSLFFFMQPELPNCFMVQRTFNYDDISAA